MEKCKNSNKSDALNKSDAWKTESLPVLNYHQQVQISVLKHPHTNKLNLDTNVTMNYLKPFYFFY